MGFELFGDVFGFRHLCCEGVEHLLSLGVNLCTMLVEGALCQVCGFDFAETYGDLGRNYIEVHCVKPLAERNGEHVVNPETDLFFLCANFYRKVHRNRNDALSMDELKESISH